MYYGERYREEIGIVSFTVPLNASKSFSAFYSVYFPLYFSSFFSFSQCMRSDAPAFSLHLHLIEHSNVLKIEETRRVMRLELIYISPLYSMQGVRIIISEYCKYISVFQIHLSPFISEISLDRDSLRNDINPSRNFQFNRSYETPTWYIHIANCRRQHYPVSRLSRGRKFTLVVAIYEANRKRDKRKTRIGSRRSDTWRETRTYPMAVSKGRLKAIYIAKRERTAAKHFEPARKRKNPNWSLNLSFVTRLRV